MDKEALKFAIENGIINVSYIQDEFEMNKREKILSKHRWAISQGKEKPPEINEIFDDLKYLFCGVNDGGFKSFYRSPRICYIQAIINRTKCQAKFFNTWIDF